MKVGDQVVARTTSTGKHAQYREKGKVYTVEGIMICRKCDALFVNIGQVSDNKELKCLCGCKQPNHKMKWTYQSEFIVVSQKSLEHAIYVEDYETAAVIRDVLNKKEN